MRRGKKKHEKGLRRAAEWSCQELFSVDVGEWRVSERMCVCVCVYLCECVHHGRV